jgi:hypothetical protein
MDGTKKTTGAWSLTTNMTHHWIMWMLSSIIQESIDGAFPFSLMQNVTGITYRLLFELLFNLIQEDHVTEKKEEEPIGLNAFQLISRSVSLNLGNLFDLNQVVTWNAQIAMSGKLRLP